MNVLSLTPRFGGIRPSMLLMMLGCLLMLGCTSFRVTFPSAGQVSSSEYQLVNDKITILVRFNQAVEATSLSAEQNIVLVTENDPSAEITVSLVSPTEIRIESVDDYGDLFDFDPDGFFQLQLSGDGEQPIRATDGDALDGDKDGSPGGVYQTGFVVLG